MASNVTRDHHLWTRDTIKNVTGDVTLDIAGDITLDAAGGDINVLQADVSIPIDKKVIFGNIGEYIVGDDTNLTISSSGSLDLNAGNTTSNDGVGFFMDSTRVGDITGHHSATYFTLYENVGASTDDYFNILCLANGETTIETVDAAGAAANINIEADGHVEFDGCGVGFDKISYTDDTNVTVDFRTGNKAELDMAGGSISGTLSLRFPNTSGNFLLVVKQDGSTRTIAAFAALDVGGNACNNDGGTGGAIRWAGGSAPDLTDGGNKDDILTFYWDADLEVCYGVATLNF